MEGTKTCLRNVRARQLAAVVVMMSGGALMAGCSKPIDEKLVTGGADEELIASVAAIAPRMTEREREALQWAVSDLDRSAIHAAYPNGSPRQIIRGEVKEVLATYPEQINLWKQQAERDAPVRDELVKVVAEEGRFSLEKNFFGLQPTIRTVVTNGSALPISQLAWRASLYLGDSADPVAQSVLDNDYRKQGGLSPGDVYNVTLTVGFVRGDESWSTLEIQNAPVRRVELEPVLSSILDFGNRPYLAEDSSQRIERAEAAIEAAKQYSDI